MYERTLEGTWWRADASNEKYGGRFTFNSARGCRLEVLGAIAPEHPFSMAEAQVPIIHGTVSAGETGNDITLFDALRVGVTSHGGFDRQELVPTLAVLGAHLKSRDHLKVRSVEVSFTQLAPWLVASGFNLKLHGKKWKSGQPLRYTLRYRPVHLPPVLTPLGKLTFKLRSLPPVFPTRTYALREYVGLELRPPKPLPLDEIRRRSLWYLQNFFTFATDHRNALTSVWIKLLRGKDSVECLFQHNFEADTVAHPLEMLFSYPVIAAASSDVFTQWVELYDRLGPALNAIYSVIYGRIQSTDIQFLNVVQAAESYDRRIHGESVVPAEEHAARVSAIVDAAPEQHREWAAGKLAHSSEAFLTERLTRLFDRLGKPFWSRMFSSRGKMKSQVWRIASRRNALTHITSDAETIAGNLQFMHVAMNQLTTAIKANLLLDLHFSHDDLLACFRNNQTYLFFSRQEEKATAESRGPTPLTS